MKNKFILIFAICALTFTRANCQKQRDFYRKIQSVTNSGWHGIILPEDIYSKLHREFYDLRIFEINGPDTVEIPYVLNFTRNELQSMNVIMRPFNKGISNGKQFMSFEVPDGAIVNNLTLAFTEWNFDALVTLEGSDDRQKWFEIAKDQRIVSISNDKVDFQATRIYFPDSQYKFLRMSINSTTMEVTRADFRRSYTKAGTYHTIKQHFTVEEHKDRKLTVVRIKADYYQPVETFNIVISSDVDYYRHFSLTAITDSANYNDRWIYENRKLTEGVLTSVKPNDFEFKARPGNPLTLEISNEDNPPLNIESITLARPETEVVAQLSPEKEYYLFYGNEYAHAPNYDIVHFTEKIPDSLAMLTLSDEVSIAKSTSFISPLIENKVWLWVIMGVVITVLGFFTLRMMKNK